MLAHPSLEHISCLLYKCRKQSERQCVLRVHAHMHQRGLEAHPSLGNYLVSVLAEVRSLRIAQQVFDKLVHGNEQSWNALITGYLKCGLPESALFVYQRMKKDDLVHPGRYTYVALLKACVNLNDFRACVDMHAEIVRLGLLERDLLLGNTLVNVYTNSGLLAKAQEVADKLPVRDVVTWNVLMAAYAKLGLAAEVLNCLEQMQFEGISPDSIAFSCCLKACGSLEHREKGEELHTMLEKKGFLGGDHVVGSSLVDMYCKCGMLTKAQQVFDKLPVKDVVSWTILIRGYVENGQGEEALMCFEQMQDEGIFPDVFTLACCLKACVSLGAADRGQEIHLEIVKQGLLEGDQVIGNMLVDLYAKCDLLADAQQVFNKLPFRDAVSCNALIAGYAEHGYDEEALKTFGRMPAEGVSPDAITYVCLLKACGRTGALDKGRVLHAEVERTGLLQKDLVVGNTIVDMYARCGFLAKAQEVFDKLPVRDIVSWTIMLAGYSEHGHGKETMKCFEDMRLLGFLPDPVTLVCSLQACSRMRALDMGHGLHAEIERKGLLESDIDIGNTLVNMYAKCGLLATAKQVFDKLPVRDVVSWNALISGYAENVHVEEALMCLDQMHHEGVFLDTTTHICVLKACARAGASHEGKEIHAELERRGLLGRDLIVSISILDMYAKCGLLAKAQQLFDELPVRDVISWTILIAKYAEHGYGEEALKYFEQMQGEGVSPDAITFICSLKACGSTGALQKGEELHAEIERNDSLKQNSFVCSSLVHMYAQCGAFAKAQQVFEKLPIQDIVSWNALIAGWARDGGPDSFVYVLDKMLGDGIKPDLVTCIIVLNACNRFDLFNGSQQTYVEGMNKGFNIISTPQICMHMNNHGCVGTVIRSLLMNKEMPLSAVGAWHAVLRACKNGGNLELGKWAFEHVNRP